MRPGGRLVFTRGCALFAATDGGNVANAKLIGDFADQKYTPMVAPEWASNW